MATSNCIDGLIALEECVDLQSALLHAFADLAGDNTPSWLLILFTFDERLQQCMAEHGKAVRKC